MIRRIIEINEEKCNGCGLCAVACHEGAIGMVDGKAKLLRDDYCDGLGDCLPACPVDAISFVEREALAYDEAAVQENMRKKKMEQAGNGGVQGISPETDGKSAIGDTNGESCSGAGGGGCQGAALREFIAGRSAQSGRGGESAPCTQPQAFTPCTEPKELNRQESPAAFVESQLSQWPVQIKLLPVNAPYFNGAHLLIAADCTAFAYGNFHNDFIKGRITLVGCPKLDAVDYSEKLTEIIGSNDIKSVTVTRMQVPCCGGIEYAVREALANSGKNIPLEVVTIGLDGTILR